MVIGRAGSQVGAIMINWSCPGRVITVNHPLPPVLIREKKNYGNWWTSLEGFIIHCNHCYWTFQLVLAGAKCLMIKLLGHSLSTDSLRCYGCLVNKLFHFLKS